MLSIPPAIYKKRRGQSKKPKKAPPAPVGLTLVEASFATDDYVSVRLTFDRAVDASGIDGTQITLGVNEFGYLYNATGAVVVLDPQTIEITCVQIGGWEGDNILNATSGTGIVAVDDGGTWDGVMDLALPFPPLP